MYRLGKIRNPYHVVLFTIITLGIYGVIWFYRTLEELRIYRGTGLPGWVFLLFVLILIITSFLAVIPFTIYMVIMGYLVPYTIDIEIAKFTYKKKGLSLLGLIPTSTPLFYFILFFQLSYVSGSTGVIGNPVVVILLIPSLNFIWIFFVQKNLNILWEIVGKTFEFAVPVYDWQTEKFYGDENDPNQYAPAPYSPYIANPDIENDTVIDLTDDEEYNPYEDDSEENSQN